MPKAEHAGMRSTRYILQIMTPDIEVSRDVAAPPAVIFAAITDITRMGEWSPECVSAEWNEGFSAPALGAMFTGHNRNGDKEWSVEAKIVDLVDNQRFFFDCIVRDFVFSKWATPSRRPIAAAALPNTHKTYASSPHLNAAP